MFSVRFRNAYGRCNVRSLLPHKLPISKQPRSSLMRSCGFFEAQLACRDVWAYLLHGSLSSISYVSHRTLYDQIHQVASDEFLFH
jgi:hypothetical protein